MTQKPEAVLIRLQTIAMALVSPLILSQFIEHAALVTVKTFLGKKKKKNSRRRIQIPTAGTSHSLMNPDEPYSLMKRIIISKITQKYTGAGETAQQLRAHTVLSEDPGPVPITPVEQLTNTCNSNSRGSDTAGLLATAFTQSHPVEMKTHPHS